MQVRENCVIAFAFGNILKNAWQQVNSI
jgi:hypothetical protein